MRGADLHMAYDSNSDDEVALTAEEEVELEESIAELDRGEFVTAGESLRKLREILYGRFSH
jgi:hypothetical protein